MADGDGGGVRGGTTSYGAEMPPNNVHKRLNQRGIICIDK